MSTPTDAATRFAEAVNARAEATARDLSEESAWTGPNLAGFYQQAARKGFGLDLLGLPTTFGARSAQWAALSKPGAARPLGQVWLLLDAAAGSWKVAGLSKVRNQVALFLRGLIGGSGELSSLPLDPLALAWAESACKAGELPDVAPEASMEAAWTVPGTNRAMVRYQLPEESPRFVYLEREGEGFRCLSEGSGPSFEAALAGLELPWEAGDAVTARPASEQVHEGLLVAFSAATAELAKDGGPQGVEAASTAAHLLAVVEGVFAMSAAEDALRGIGPSGPTLVKSPPLEEADPSPISPETAAPVPPADPAVIAANSETGGEPTETPGIPNVGALIAEAGHANLPPKVRAAVEGYLSEEVAAGRIVGEEVAVDNAFLQQHGAQLTGRMLGAFFQEVLPEGLAFEVKVPTPTPDGGPVESKPVRLKLDLGGIIAKAFAGPRAKPGAPESDPK
jgi:hypothetical protein